VNHILEQLRVWDHAMRVAREKVEDVELDPSGRNRSVVHIDHESGTVDDQARCCSMTHAFAPAARPSFKDSLPRFSSAHFVGATLFLDREGRAPDSTGKEWIVSMEEPKKTPR